METTLVLIKPDGVQRGLIGQMIARFEAKGLQLAGLKLLSPPAEVLEKHYAVHAERPFYPGLIRFMSSGPVVAMALRGDEAISVVRRMMGETDGKMSPGGTIRGDFGMSKGYNLIHGSDGADTAAFELDLWFSEGLVDYDVHGSRWVYEPAS